MKSIKNIVVATDFSGTSHAAYNYAQHLAEIFGASIRLVNVYQIPTLSDNLYPMDYLPNLDSLQETAMMRLKQFASDEAEGGVAVATKTKVTCEAYAGFVTDKLIELSYEPGVDLIVLGAKGEHDWLDKFIGSVAVKTSLGANCPVLLVPSKAQFSGIRNIVYAAASDSASLETVRTVLDIAKTVGGALHFIHVKLPSESLNNKTNEQLFKRIVSNEKPQVEYLVDSIVADTIKAGIYDYASKNSSDLLTIVTHHRKFWESFWHNSSTAAVAWEAALPILVLHRDEKDHASA